jgi:hypothetical protein
LKEKKKGKPSLASAASWKEGKPSLASAESWKEGMSSLASAASWKEVYRSETFWYKEILAYNNVVTWWQRAGYTKSVEEDYENESWEMIYESEREYERLCRGKGIYYKDVFTTWRRKSQEPYSRSYLLGSGRDYTFSDSDDDDWRPRMNRDYGIGCGTYGVDSDGMLSPSD